MDEKQQCRLHRQQQPRGPLVRSGKRQYLCVALFQSDRTFRLWSARAGHGLLLLRSNKGDGGDTRVDVLFKPVSAMKLLWRLTGLLVREATLTEKKAIERDVGRAEQANEVFVIEARDFNGYVIAAMMVHHEDYGDYDEPSFFDRVE
jgi:hypothetical protein